MNEIFKNRLYIPHTAVLQTQSFDHKLLTFLATVKTNHPHFYILYSM